MTEAFRICVPGVDLILYRKIDKIEELLTNKSALVNVEIPDYNALVTMLSNVDWWYMYSDDGSVYRRGKQQSDLLDLWSSVSAEFKACLSAYKYLQVHSVESSPFHKWPDRFVITHSEFLEVYEANLKIFKDLLIAKEINPPAEYLEVLQKRYAERCGGTAPLRAFTALKEQLGKPLYDTPENDKILIDGIMRASELSQAIRMAVTNWRPSRNRLFDIEGVTLPAELEDNLNELVGIITKHNLTKAPFTLSAYVKLSLVTLNTDQIQLPRFALEQDRINYGKDKMWFVFRHTSAVIGF